MADLNEAARQGNVDALYAEIRNNPSVLENMEDTRFTDSPLHIAARLGHTLFALEMVMMKPSLAKKLNESCHSPMHLAVMNNHQELVKGLLSIDKDLIRVKGKEGRTPLHCVAATVGASSVLFPMLSVCPDAIEDLTFRRESVVHLAVKNDHFDAYLILIKFIEKFDKQAIYRLQDEDGCTVMYLAITLRQFEMVRLLFYEHSFRPWKLGLVLKDNNRQAVQDLLKVLQEDTEIPLLLKLSSRYTWKWQFPGVKKAHKAFQKRPAQSLDALLVVLALVMTVTMQIGVSPPGGFWQEDGNINGTAYYAGDPIMLTTHPVNLENIAAVNLVVFFISLALIWKFTSHMPRKYAIRLVLILFSIIYYLSAGFSLVGTLMVAGAVMYLSLLDFFLV